LGIVDAILVDYLQHTSIENWHFAKAREETTKL
jgi:hypothetical protein